MKKSSKNLKKPIDKHEKVWYSEYKFKRIELKNKRKAVAAVKNQRIRMTIGKAVLVW